MRRICMTSFIDDPFRRDLDGLSPSPPAALRLIRLSLKREALLLLTSGVTSRPRSRLGEDLARFSTLGLDSDSGCGG